MGPLPNRRIVLAKHPEGRLAAEHFTTATDNIRPRWSDEVLIKVLYAHVPPAARAAMTTTTVFPPTEPGDRILAVIVGEVVDGPETGPAPGALVTCPGGWEEYTLAHVSQVREVPDHPRVYEHLGLLGDAGLAAYFGMLNIGQVSFGDTVVVSGAGGGVGHLAGQLAARVAGAKVIGITGSDAKNLTLVREFGFAGAINRRGADFEDELDELAPDGVDVFFDTTGGPVLDAVLPVMANRGRIVCCGAVAGYDTPGNAIHAHGPRGVPQLIVNKGLHLQGLLIEDFQRQQATALGELALWAARGRITALTEIRDGLDAAPQALVDLLAGKNLGQMVVRVAEQSAPDQTRTDAA